MMLAIDVAATAPRTIDVVGVPVYASGPVPRQLGLPRARLVELGFEGKLGQTLSIPAARGPLVVAVGLGEPSGVNGAVLRSAAAALARAAGTRTSLATSLADLDGGLAPAAAAQAVAEGFALGCYRFSAFKTEAAQPQLERVVLTASANRRTAARHRQRARAGGGGGRRPGA